MNRSGGFTLIELVAVIILLGILAATAIPRFAGITTDARIASLKSARGSIKSALKMFNMKMYIDGIQDQDVKVTIDGVTYWNLWGYPHVKNKPNDLPGIMNLAGLDTGEFELTYEDVTPHDGTDRVKVSPKGASDPNTCFISILQATDANTPPVLDEDFSGC